MSPSQTESKRLTGDCGPQQIAEFHSRDLDTPTMVSKALDVNTQIVYAIKYEPKLIEAPAR